MPRKLLSYYIPTDLSGLVSWWKADSLVLSDGDAVGTWADSGSGANDATQSTAGNKPTYKTNIINGKPVVRFDGGDGLVVANESNFDIETPSVFIVATRTSGSGRIMSKSTTGFADGRRRKIEFLFTDGTTFRAGSGADATGINLTVTSTSVPAVYGFTSSSDTSHRFYYNGSGTDSTSTLSESSSNFNNASLLIGSAFSAGTESFNGDIAEIIIFNRALSEPEAIGLMNYLATKYNITSDILGGYPRSAVTKRFMIRDFGTCISFNNSSTFIQNLNVSLTGAFTILTWFKKKDDDFNWIFAHGTGSQKLGISNTNVFFTRMVNAGSNVTADIGYTSSLNHKWNFLAAKRNSSDSISASLNGAASVVAGTLTGTFNFTQLGKDNGATWFFGDLDEIAVYDGVDLTDAQIAEIYYSGILPTTNLIAHWMMDEGSGTALTDSTGIQSNGLINNGSYSSNVRFKPRTAK